MTGALPAPEPARTPRPAYRETFRFATAGVRIEAPQAASLAEIRRAYGAFIAPADTPAGLVLRLEPAATGLAVYRDDEAEPFAVLAAGHLLPRLEHEIHHHLLECLPADLLLLHAAAVVHQGRAWLLPATSGSGKTTLSALLVASGWGYATDELVLLDRAGRAVPFPKAFSLKPAAFPLFRHLSPPPAGGGIWYLDAEALRPGSIVRHPTPVGGVIFPSFVAGSPTRITPLTLGETLLGLFEHAVRFRRQGEAGLDRLLAVARSAAPGFRLHFGDARAACQALRERLADHPPP